MVIPYLALTRMDVSLGLHPAQSVEKRVSGRVVELVLAVVGDEPAERRRLVAPDEDLVGDGQAHVE